MPPQIPPTVVIDTSILLNFLKVRQVALLGRAGFRILLLDQVLAEITQPEQKKTLQRAIETDIFNFDRVTDAREVDLFANLHASGRLGAGECAVLAVAIARDLVAGVQDRRARAEGARRSRGLRLSRRKT